MTWDPAEYGAEALRFSQPGPASEAFKFRVVERANLKCRAGQNHILPHILHRQAY